MNPWIIVGFLVALIAVGVGGYTKGEKDGVTKTEAVWQTREAKINAETAAKIAENSKQVAANEHAKALQLSAIDASYQQQLKVKNERLDLALNAVRDGSRKLFIDAACPTPGSNGLPGSAASAGVGNGTTRIELPRQVELDIHSVGSDADQVTVQLAACQAIVRADRK